MDLAALLYEARACARKEPDRSVELFHQIVAQGEGTEWAEAQYELLLRAYGHADIVQAVTRAQLVLDAQLPGAADCAKALCAVVLNLARRYLDEPLDMEQLERATRVCETCDEHYMAGCAHGLLAHGRQERGDRAGAKAALLRAEVLYDRAGSMIGGPGVLRRLAEILIDEGDWVAAAACVQRALQRLAMFPYGGMHVRGCKREILALQARITTHLDGEPGA